MATISFFRTPEFKTDKEIDGMVYKLYGLDEEEIINDQKIPPLKKMMESINWDIISKGIPVRFHGDLHFENILICSSSDEEPFALLDWRQDFAGELLYGDIYYDFAKLLHGLIVSHELIAKDFYNVSRKINKVSYEFLQKNSMIECREYFKKYTHRKGTSVYRS